ncbi:CC0125/CC1285 family lipoprotein [Shewanella sp. AS16]|uniref:CC0125/CC1285 family lipoprotein n=1 Tax=Shewanella sp. AS16 TaxID=2907625 RepID=UPI001F490571|nr:hypothetical protein [Shewanella sp. AS16]
MNIKEYKMQMMNRLFILGLMFCISACTAPSYQAYGLRGGYQDKFLAADTYRVTYNGNGKVSLAMARDFALLRCAVLTKQHGYSHFWIKMDRVRVSRTTVSATPLPIEKPYAFIEIQFVDSDFNPKYRVRNADEVIAAKQSQYKLSDRQIATGSRD